MLLKLYEDNPDPRLLKQLNECLLDGGVIIYPTDTLYAFGCNMFKPKAIERIARIRNVDMDKHNFTIIFHDLSHLADFAKPIDNRYFKIIKRCLPGPFTFIFEANNHVPKQLHRKKKQVGIRIPDNAIARQLVIDLQNPMLSTSIPSDDVDHENFTDPALIYDQYRDKIDMMVDAGFSGSEWSTIVDFSGDDLQIVREGKGDLSLIY
jgi:tRNA threonylcarbamoyl adenosine modification protein (Sua5/YciO/YrdC/YwlC family)